MYAVVMKVKRLELKDLVKKVVVMLLCIAMTIGILPPVSAGADPLLRETVESVFPAEKLAVDTVTAFERQNPLTGTMAGVFLADLSSGELIASKNSTMIVSTSELTEWLIPLYLFRNVDLQKEVTVTAAMLTEAKKAKYPVMAGLQANDVISVEELILLFLMTRADDVRAAIVSGVLGSEEYMVSKLNLLTEKITLNNTKVLYSDGAYASGQHTNAYDLYVVFRELLTHDLFAKNYKKASLSVSVTKTNGTARTIRANNSEHGYSNLYGTPRVPEGYTFLARMSGGCATSGLGQVMLAEGPDGHVYMTVLTGIPFEKDIAIETERLIRVLEGETYTDQEQVIPFGDDATRYEYLLGTEVVYYTLDNKAPGYANHAEAQRYMMDITVPVWKLNEATGVRTASTMKLTINRKLVSGVRKIFQEIYELPMKFPMKTLLGYGYRKSGGVGLSNCTLMSIHSYGAAIDINPADNDNDYFLGAGNDLRDTTNPYYIPEEVIQIFEKYGWFWGGDFSICVDSMHFQYLGLDFLTYQNNSPFMTVDLAAELEVGNHIENLQLRLTELGYRVNQNGIFTEQTREAVKKFQIRQGLPGTGVVDYKTWETVINLTHYMPFVF